MNAPVIIIGAPRSGTNILRDVLVSVPGYATWPCDEINLVWRHGNRSFRSDEFTAEMATPKVAEFVGRHFDRIGKRYGGATVVEKTCASSLRVGFVDRVVPDARFLFIHRDGMDVAASAMQRWHAPFDWDYTKAKLPYVPPSDLGYYGIRFVSNRLKARGHDAAGDKQVGSWWGPKLDGQAELQQRHTLDELCALQWQRCVENSERDLASIDPTRVHRIAYEEFVKTPSDHLTEVLDFLGAPREVDPSWVASVSMGSVGKGRASLGEAAVERLTGLVRPSLERYGYA